MDKSERDKDKVLFLVNLLLQFVSFRNQIHETLFSIPSSIIIY